MNEGTKPTPEFEAWAKSFSGCDGGDLNAPIWFCGIENGANKSDQKKREKQTKEDFLEKWKIEVDDWKKLQCPKGISDRKEFFSNNPYDQKVLKLHASMFHELDEKGKFVFDDIDKYKNSNDVPDFLAYANKYQMYGNSSTSNRSVFKLNLFPLAFNSTDHGKDWSAEARATGLDDASYHKYCRDHRFSQIKKWVLDNSPVRKLIICTGKTYEKDFVMAFIGEQTGRKEIDWNNGSKKLILHTGTSDSSPMLIITPFLGFWRHCLNKDSEIAKVGRAIRDEVKDKLTIFR